VRFLLPLVRLATAAAAVVGIVAEYRVNLAYLLALGVPGIAGKTLDFALYFTVEANSLGVIVLVVGAVRVIRGRTEPPSTAWVTLRLAATAYLVITCLVYQLLLRDIPGPPALELDWADEILHGAVPLVVLLDWLFAPDRRPVRAAAIGRVMIAPVAWVVVTLLRGPVTGDQATGSGTYYPYPFLDPAASPDGYASVAGYVVGLTVVLCGIVAALVATSRLPTPGEARRRAIRRGIRGRRYAEQAPR
jgi:hypothetical protein